MKQIVQDLKSGKTLLEEVPTPKPLKGEILIKSHFSLVSLGTEKMLVEFGKANYIQKARSQPEKFKQVLQKIKTDGLKPTVEAVFRKLGQPMPLGYCNAGEVVGLGEGVSEFSVGDRVISNGPHAEFVVVPENLVAKIPESVSLEEAVFTVIGSIGLQGIRLVKPEFGETVVVVGLGLIGLITAQLLRANGCRVIGLDVDEDKVSLAKSLSVQAYNSNRANPVSSVLGETNGVGADAVLICASNQGNEIISQAAHMSRKRGRIVLVGVVGLKLNRSDFYEKELSFQVSCSYGPGRYDQNYEKKGLDYPIEYVRWTEKRNFESFLQAIEANKLQLKPLISETVKLDNYQNIYENLSNKRSIASLIQYEPAKKGEFNEIKLYEKNFDANTPIIGIIGAGNYCSSVIIPTLSDLKAQVKSIASSKGLTATIIAKKYKIPIATSENKKILNDPNIHGVIIGTRHHQHAQQVINGLSAQKHVFVEKPLALNYQELSQIETAYGLSSASLTVGFNRRFSPFSRKIKSQIENQSGPINVIVTINAGSIPSSHWTQDLEIGGGRIIGEACHFIDLISYFAGSEVSSVVMNALGVSPERDTDNASIMLKYKDGSQGAIHYFSNGHKAFPKERIEIYSNGTILVNDNFRKLKFYGSGARSVRSSQNKGQYQQFEQWLRFLEHGGEPPIPYKCLINTSKTAIACLDSLQKHDWIDID